MRNGAVRWKLLIALAAVALAAILGWRWTHPKAQAVSSDARAVLDHPDLLEVVALDVDDSADERGPTDPDGFHGWRELSRRKLVNPTLQDQVRSALYHAIDRRFHSHSACIIEPRHAIHAVKGDQTVDIVICFACEQALIYTNGATKAAEFEIAGDPEPFFNKLFDDVGLPRDQTREDDRPTPASTTSAPAER